MGKLNVVVRDRYIDTYYHDGKVFIEGRKGSDYTIEYHNNSPQRVKVVLSVDGLNVVSGDNNWGRGYVVEPWQSIKIPGWRKDNNNVAKFVFSSARGSYNQHNDAGHKMNIGVIGAMVFAEVLPVYAPVYNHVPVYDGFHPRPTWPMWTTCGYNTIGAGSFNNAADDVGAMATGGGTTTAAYTAAAAANVAGTMRSAKLSAAPEPAVNNMGTAWGANQHFSTQDVNYIFHEVAFETLTIYYDDYRGLKERGINVKEKYKPDPQPFPNYTGGCPDPKYNYRG